MSDYFLFKEFVGKTPGIFPIYEYPAVKTMLIRAEGHLLSGLIATRPEVIFIDKLRIAREEVAVSNFDNSTNKVNMIHNRYPQFNGQGLSVMVKENRPDTLDIDFKGRFISTPFMSSTLSSHATIMATIIAGAGNSYYEGKGVAPAAGISSVNFTVLLPEPDNVYQQFNISVENHSYGTGIENFYAADAAAYDASVITRPTLAHVFSAGNSGTLTGTTGPYVGVPGYGNITGSFKMAKNIITVGHTDSLGVVLPLSSKGPAYDGRLKPDLVAFGEDGSSGAAAIVSGIALAMQQAYEEVNAVLPSNALVKAILVNTADDADGKGIDFKSGYGSVNAYKALQGIVNVQHSTGSVSTGGTNMISLIVPPNLRQMKITLAWNDPPAAVNAAKALQNDLDLELFLPTTNESWLPWVLSHFPHIDSLQKIPVRKRDSLNTAEQITVDNPVAGTYQIRVKGFNVAVSPSQSFFISYLFDTLDRFQWQYPVQTDNIFGGASNTLRWQSSWPQLTGQLEYSINNGSSWQLISNNVDLARGYYKWNAPDTFVSSLLRMSFNSQAFGSEPFTISKRIKTFVGFNCPDSFLFYWNKAKGVSSYQVYKLGTRVMDPLVITTDTVVTLGKITNPSLYYAVAPVLTSKTGVRSYAIDYTAQGVGCYIKSFFVSLSSNTSILDLEIGIANGIKSITWEKLTMNGYIPLQTTSAISGIFYSFTDQSLSFGINTYRTKILLLNGQIIYSNPESVNYFGSRYYIIYPNPARQGQPVKLLLKDPEPTLIEVFTIGGVKLFTKTVNDISTSLPLERLSGGIYMLRLSAANKPAESLKLIIH